VRPPALDELATLVDAIDRMAAHIAQARGALEREKRVMERMLESITSAVVSLDSRHRVVLQNEVAAVLLGSSFDRPLDEALAADPRLEAVRRFVAGAGAGDLLRSETVRLPPRDSDQEEPAEWTLSWVPIAGDGEPTALLVVEDVSEVLRGQRLAAWAEMARMIAHEIKNPLTPIRLSAEHMREVRLRDPDHFEEVFARCTHNILVHVDELQEISSDFSIYSRIPRIELEEGDLALFTERLLEGYRAAPPRGVSLEYDGPEGPLPARFDPKLLSRALRNLIENALRAVAAGGTVAVRLTRQEEEGELVLQVEDDGPGVPEGHLDRIFEPYFSTHDTGTGLGLPIARRVVEEHGGRITARNLSGGGLRVVVRLPAAESQGLR
jgi:two-component system nitrogen regulation sensor histidine kinase NtrY